MSIETAREAQCLAEIAQARARFRPGDRVACISAADGSAELGTVVDGGDTRFLDLLGASQSLWEPRIRVRMDDAERYHNWTYVTWRVSQVRRIDVEEVR